MKLVVAKLARVLLILAATVVGLTEIARGPAGLGPNVYLAGAVAAQAAQAEGAPFGVARADAPTVTRPQGATWSEVDDGDALDLGALEVGAADLGAEDLGEVDLDAADADSEGTVVASRRSTDRGHPIRVARSSHAGRALPVHGFLGR